MFSVGVVMYELSTLDALFDGASDPLVLVRFQ